MLQHEGDVGQRAMPEAAGLGGRRVSGAGEMAERIRSFPWSETALGPMEGWTETLLTTVNLMLGSPWPMQLFWGPEFVVLYNDGLLPILTAKHPAALGRPAQEVWAEAWAIIGPQMMGVRQSGRAIAHGALLVPIERDGTMQDAYWDYSYSAVFGPNGQVEGVLDIVRDMTETVVTARAKRDADEQLELAMEAAELGMWFFDPETGVVVADDRMHRIFGSPDRSGSVAYWLELLHPEDKDRVGRHFVEALEDKRAYELDYRIVTPEGVRWLHSKARVFHGAGGRSRMIGVVEDISARKRVEAALELSEGELRLSQAEAVRSGEQLKVITDALPALVSYLDNEGRYVRVNRTYEDWFQRPFPSIVGKTIEEVLGESAAREVRGHFNQALAGEPIEFEYKVWLREEERTLKVLHMPDRDTAGRVRGVIVQGQDVTEQKRAEQALIQNEKLAAVGRLAASIAHEINNPLESVTNLLYLARTTHEQDRLQQYLELAERELRRVSVISNQTLRFYRQSTRPRAVGCDDLFESVLSIYQGRLVNSQVRVERQCDAEARVECFDGEIRQVLTNLVGNAVDAMHPAGGRLLVRGRSATSWRTGQKGMTLTVADTGSGMTAAVLRRAFDAFYTTKGIGGTGLGLWVSKEIVDRHHGSLRMRSSTAEGHSGTVFTLFLPEHASSR